MTQSRIRKVFISYRQADNRPFVMLIHRYLTDKYGADGVFLDFNTLPPFVKFEDFIRQRIQESDAVLAIIGHDWLKHFNDRAAENEKDYVKIELETALRLNKLIAPVCIMGAVMPRRRDVPESLRDLCDVNAVQLTDGQSFYEAMARLIDGLESALPSMTAEDYYARADQKWRDKDYDGVIEDCTEAIRLKPNYAAAYSRRGVSRDIKGYHDDAIVDFTEAIRLDPDFSKVYNNRGNSRTAKGDLDGAIIDYTEAIHLDPKLAIAYNNRGLARKAKGDIEGAIADYTEAIHLDPKYAFAYFNRGNALQVKGDLDGVIADTTEAIRLDPKYVSAYLNRGLARELKPDVRGAIADWEQYLALGGTRRDEVTQWIADARKKLK